MLKGKDKYETLENFSILFIVMGAGILSSGIGLTIVSPKGVSAILAISGALVSFLAIVALIFIWLARELFAKEVKEEKVE